MSDEEPKTGRDKNGRFLKNYSGNPEGRRKKAPATPESSLDVIFDRTVSMKAADGSIRELSAQEAIDQATVLEAFKGKAGPIKRVVRMLIRRDKWIRSEAAKKAQRAKEYERNPYSDIKMHDDPENANEALQILGIATRDAEYEAAVDRPGYVHLRLEHWAVEMALSRRRGSEPLSPDEVKSVDTCTHDPDALNWPKGSRA